MFEILSHPIDTTSPGWPGNPQFEFEPFTLIKNGDVANTYSLKLFNHFGTHFDAPNHFYEPGLKIAELPPECFIYDRPLLIEVPKTFAEFVTKADLEPYAQQLAECDMLMIRTGIKEMREKEPHKYAYEGPAFSAEAAKYLMDNFKIKALGVDWISLASFLYGDDGKEAHLNLLGAYHDHFTCIIEDANFEGIVGKKVKRVMAIPLLVKDIDSAPVTVIAECE